MNITIANLIDQLQICNMKIWALEDLKRKNDISNDAIADATKKTNTLNVQRNLLIQGIDEGLNEIAEGKKQQLFGQGTTKMYGNNG